MDDLQQGIDRIKRRMRADLSSPHEQSMDNLMHNLLTTVGVSDRKATDLLIEALGQERQATPMNPFVPEFITGKAQIGPWNTTVQRDEDYQLPDWLFDRP